MADPQGTPKPTSVYRYYDEFDLLLYVGVTSRGAVRNAEHYSTKSWWRHVVRQDVEHLPSREAALRRELSLIAEFRPPFNTQHNPGSEELREAYLRVREAGRSPVGVESEAGRNRIPLIVSNGRDATVLRSAALPEGLRSSGAFPIAGARLIWHAIERGHFVARVRVKGRASAASLMYRHEPDGSLTIKRVDVEIEPNHASLEAVN